MRKFYLFFVVCFLLMTCACSSSSVSDSNQSDISYNTENSESSDLNNKNESSKEKTDSEVTGNAKLTAYTLEEAKSKDVDYAIKDGDKFYPIFSGTYGSESPYRVYSGATDTRPCLANGCELVQFNTNEVADLNKVVAIYQTTGLTYTLGDSGGTITWLAAKSLDLEKREIPMSTYTNIDYAGVTDGDVYTFFKEHAVQVGSHRGDWMGAEATPVYALNLDGTNPEQPFYLNWYTEDAESVNEVFYADCTGYLIDADLNLGTLLNTITINTTPTDNGYFSIDTSQLENGSYYNITRRNGNTTPGIFKVDR